MQNQAMGVSGLRSEYFFLLSALIVIALLFTSFSMHAQESPAGTPGTVPASAQIGHWHAIAKLVDGQRVLYMRLSPSPAPKDGSSYELVLSCKAKSTEAYIEWKAFGESPHDSWSDELSVFYSFDGEPGEYAKWAVSADKYELSIPRPIEFIQSLHDRKVLTVIPDARGVPPGESMSFILKGLEDVLNQLYEGCYK